MPEINYHSAENGIELFLLMGLGGWVHHGAYTILLHQYFRDMLSELGNRIANVSSSIDATSSVQIRGKMGEI